MSATEIRNLVLVVLSLCIAACLPFAGSDYWLSIGLTIAMFTALATSWAIFSGPTHLISLATAAFFGLGTYVTGLGFEVLPFWSLVVLAGIAGAVIAALVGLATLRLSGVYFVSFTLGLAELIRQVITWGQNMTGQKGLYVLTDVTETHIYWMLVALSGLEFLAGWRSTGTCGVAWGKRRSVGRQAQGGFWCLVRHRLVFGGLGDICQHRFVERKLGRRQGDIELCDRRRPENREHVERPGQSPGQRHLRQIKPVFLGNRSIGLDRALGPRGDPPAQIRCPHGRARPRWPCAAPVLRSGPDGVRISVSAFDFDYR